MNYNLNEEDKSNISNEINNFYRDCKKSYDYIPTVLPAVERIIVLGDIHGDLKLMYKLLYLAKVINKQRKWIGGKTHVVQVGDQIDRCRPNPPYNCSQREATYNDEASDRKILQYMTRLHRKAKKEGGAVISLLGNHEILNSLGQMRYVSYEGLREFTNYTDPKNPEKKFKSGEEARKHAFAPGNEIGNFLGCTRLSLVIIGNNLFVHAGLIPEFMKNFNISNRGDLSSINTIVRKWLLNKNSNNINSILLEPKNSLFWTRLLGSIPPNLANNDKRCSKNVNPVLEKLEIGSIVIGHTPQSFVKYNTGINTTCNKSLWRVDTGSSKAFNIFNIDKKYISSQRRPQILEITNDNNFKIII
jgi:hypothetical protein